MVFLHASRDPLKENQSWLCFGWPPIIVLSGGDKWWTSPERVDSMETVTQKQSNARWGQTKGQTNASAAACQCFVLVVTLFVMAAWLGKHAGEQESINTSERAGAICVHHPASARETFVAEIIKTARCCCSVLMLHNRSTHFAGLYNWDFCWCTGVSVPKHALPRDTTITFLSIALVMMLRRFH